MRELSETNLNLRNLIFRNLVRLTNSLSPAFRSRSQKYGQELEAIPHVTQHDDIDVTDLETFRKEMEPTLGKLERGSLHRQGSHDCTERFSTVKRLPKNDGEIGFERVHSYGLAVNVKDGLLVPVIKNADQKDCGVVL
ncbi:MAG: hypothetical protein CM15mV40_080 [Caudoviricetes sp.]|nr:MAG: hypothetical protein CM15mV40_080 [Caudoviricetes sp.]